VTPVFLGAKQEGLAIVNFLNKLIVSCKEVIALRFSSNSWWRFTVGCRIIVYVLKGAVPSNVKRMSLIFKISKINLV
jgi:hypothetical protein